ncbi:hypothetical protein HY386_01835 [Candidatus Daviesbacteria bacterium]|nr:hypothetical protein [Candidatus Daviesbacteria bacterium]
MGVFFWPDKGKEKYMRDRVEIYEEAILQATLIEGGKEKDRYPLKVVGINGRKAIVVEADSDGQQIPGRALEQAPLDELEKGRFGVLQISNHRPI